MKTFFEAMKDNGVKMVTSAQLTATKKKGVAAIFTLLKIDEWKNLKTKATLAGLRKGDSKNWKNNQEKCYKELTNPVERACVYVKDVEMYLSACPGVVDDAGENVHPEGCSGIYYMEPYAGTQAYHCPTCKDFVNKKAKGKTATDPRAKLTKAERAKALLTSMGINDTEKYDDRIAELKIKLGR